jgi:hypothetical protein
VQITDAYVMWAADNYGNDPWQGIEWFHQGCVRDVENSYGSVSGRAGRPDDEITVHVYVKDGVLAYSCNDCYDATPHEDDAGEPVPRLCPHAVAVALSGVAQDATWYELPQPPSRPTVPRPRGWDAQQIQGTILRVLGDHDAHEVLRQLIRTQPELITEAEQAAVCHLDRDSQIWARKSTQRALTKFDPAQLPILVVDAVEEPNPEFADEGLADECGPRTLETDEILLAYGLRPLVSEIDKRCAAGAARGGRSVMLGILECLYSLRNQAPWTEPEVTDYVGEDLLVETAHGVVMTYTEWYALSSHDADELRAACPEWSDQLLGKSV